MAQPPSGTIARFLIDHTGQGNIELTDDDIEAADLDEAKKEILRSRNFAEVRNEVQKEAEGEGAQAWVIAAHPQAWVIASVAWFR
jgi:hypothetical protein